MASCKWPPKLEDGSSYENWRKDVEIWCKLTEIAKKKQALAIHLSLSGRARVATSEIEVSDLEGDNGVETILKKLDDLFLVDKGRRQFTAFQELYNMRRPNEGKVREFMSEFEHTYYKFTKQGMTLPDSVMAFMLLASCNLSETQQQLVMSAISEVTFQNMKSALTRIFHQEVSAQPIKPVACDIKSEPVFLGDECGKLEADVKGSESLFVRGQQHARSRGAARSYRSRGRSLARGRGAARRQNPPGPDGRITRCLVCDSRFHWARECPDAYENKGDAENSDNAGKDNDRTVNFSLFTGYADGNLDNKLSKLVREARGCAVLDSGCSTTVCGVKWLDEFLGEFSDAEWASIVEEKSSATFTFADGVTVPSLKCITLPCSIGGIKGNIKTDVVDCNIPLLLSKKSMKKANVVLNFGSDQVTINGSRMDLKTSSSGHYLLPISE